MRIWYCMQVWAKNENARCNSGGFEGSFLGSGSLPKLAFNAYLYAIFLKKYGQIFVRCCFFVRLGV